jgi:hypothetical protein
VKTRDMAFIYYTLQWRCFYAASFLKVLCGDSIYFLSMVKPNDPTLLDLTVTACTHFFLKEGVSFAEFFFEIMVFSPFIDCSF